MIDCDDMPDDLRINAPVLWAGPHCHGSLSAARRPTVHNLVVTFHSRQQKNSGREKTAVRKRCSLILPAFITARARCWISDTPGAAGRPPIAGGRKMGNQAAITLVAGDAAHPVAQYGRGGRLYGAGRHHAGQKRWNAATATRRHFTSV
ncbi:hypothetical protein KCP71_15820 [Salmonella enterica subsp. enterica]|nr:hypothetical protein KCP71_15820 [Salmonella enterica subsp. enterica]